MAFDKVIDSVKLDTDLTAVADSIRAKSGTAESLTFPEGFKSAIDNIPVGGGEDTLKSLLLNTLTEYKITEDFSPGAIRVGCSSLVKFACPNLTRKPDNYFMYGCTKLEYVDLGKIATLGEMLLTGMHRLTTVILRNTSVVNLSSVFGNNLSISREDYTYYCYFYVPKSLIEEYKVATNWSAYAHRFRAIEDYPEEVNYDNY